MAAAVVNKTEVQEIDLQEAIAQADQTSADMEEMKTALEVSRNLHGLSVPEIEAHRSGVIVSNVIARLESIKTSALDEEGDQDTRDADVLEMENRVGLLKRKRDALYSSLASKKRSAAAVLQRCESTGSVTSDEGVGCEPKAKVQTAPVTSG